MQRRRQKALYRSIRTALTFTMVAFATAIMCQTARAEWVPQLNHMTHEGLDVRRNPIDRLLSIHGFACNSNPKYTIPCRFEKTLVKYLETLPANRDDIAREITSLGGACENGAHELNCIYKRRVRRTAYLAGDTEPRSIVDNYFTVEFLVSGAPGDLQYAAKFVRVEKAIQRPGENPDTNREARDI